MEEKDKVYCEKLWREYEEDVRKLCKSRMKGLHSMVDDIVSSVFFALCQEVGKGTVIEKPKNWLYFVANNKMNDYFRELKTTRDNTDSDIEMEEIEETLPFVYSVSEDVLKKLDYENLRKIIEEILSPGEMELVNLIYYRELKMREVAELTGMTVSAVKQKNYRICHKLRKYLNENKNFERY